MHIFLFELMWETEMFFKNSYQDNVNGFTTQNVKSVC